MRTHWSSGKSAATVITNKERSSRCVGFHPDKSEAKESARKSSNPRKKRREISEQERELKQIRDAASYPVRSAGAALDSRERNDDEESRATGIKRRTASERAAGWGLEI